MTGIGKKLMLFDTLHGSLKALTLPARSLQMENSFSFSKYPFPMVFCILASDANKNHSQNKKALNTFLFLISTSNPCMSY